MTLAMLTEPIIVKNDLPAHLLDLAISDGNVCIDIETTGLDFHTAEIGSIQVLIDRSIYIVRPPFFDAKIIRRILADEEVRKIFHHASL